MYPARDRSLACLRLEAESQLLERGCEEALNGLIFSLGTLLEKKKKKTFFFPLEKNLRIRRSKKLLRPLEKTLPCTPFTKPLHFLVGRSVGRSVGFMLLWLFDS